MKLFQWHDSLKTGMVEIDRQHKELIKRINAFLKSCMEEPRDFRQMIETFEFLNEYVIVHFGVEEKLMAEHQFPQIDYHLKDHRDFRQWVDESTARIKNRDFPEDLVMEANYRLVEWLQMHIRNRDRNMSKFFQKIASEKKIPALLAMITGSHQTN